MKVGVGREDPGEPAKVKLYDVDVNFGWDG
jgi:hypothetical protein